MLYLVKQNKIYHLRIKVPPDLIRIIGRHEMRFTLKESQKRLAIKKVNAIKCRIHNLLERIRAKELEVFRMLAKGELTKEELSQIVREYVIQLIDNYDQDHAFGKYLNSDTIDKELDALDFGIVYCKEQFSERRHKEAMGSRVDSLLMVS